MICGGCFGWYVVWLMRLIALFWFVSLFKLSLLLGVWCFTCFGLGFAWYCDLLLWLLCA